MTTRPTTEALIAQLASCPPPPRLSGPGAAAWLFGAIALAVGLFLLLAGPRADLGQAIGEPELLLKLMLPMTIALSALLLALRSARPDAKVALWPLAVPVAAALGLFLSRLTQTPMGEVAAGIMGSSALACLLSISLLAAPATITGLVLFRRGAALRPGLTGGLVGLAASGGAAAGYALYCTEDSPLFFTTWYGIAILAISTVGALLGHRMLRW
nr:DUF1109 domain-containing protein [Paracoccus saliphilus]